MGRSLSPKILGYISWQFYVLNVAFLIRTCVYPLILTRTTESIPIYCQQFLTMLLPAAILFFLGLSSASPIELLDSQSLEERQTTCPGVHVFGARETTVAQGYGTSAVVVNLVLAAYSGSTSEAIVYPACGGQSSCGSISYANSVLQGVAAVASQVNAFNTKCPNTQLVLVGYSQV
jgi:acetylxylan esterase